MGMAEVFMAQITWDGVTFDSGWIDWHIARFKDQSIIWAVRRQALRSEVALSEASLESMLLNAPDDAPGLAHSRAYLDALKQAEKEVNAEALGHR
jgi:hypothetical protein